MSDCLETESKSLERKVVVVKFRRYRARRCNQNSGGSICKVIVIFISSRQLESLLAADDEWEFTRCRGAWKCNHLILVKSGGLRRLACSYRLRIALAAAVVTIHITDYPATFIHVDFRAYSVYKDRCILVNGNVAGKKAWQRDTPYATELHAYECLSVRSKGVRASFSPNDS